jgi:hypothetical protein
MLDALLAPFLRCYYQKQFLFYLGLFFLLLAGCKKPGADPEEKAAPIKTEKGVSTGAAVTKMIDAAGGELLSGDGRLVVTVPAGTVTAPTAFSIEPITNTLYGERKVKPAYRLKPEGVSFARPVRLQFKYDAAQLTAGQEDLQGIAFQTQEGYWKVEPSALDKANRTLTVETTHFSDWSHTVLLELHSEKRVLMTEEMTELWITSAGENDLLTNLGLYDLPGRMQLSSIKNWRVLNGGGQLEPFSEASNLLNKAKYTAPGTVSGTGEVEVGVELNGQFRISDPSASGGARLFSQVHLIEKLIVIGSGISVNLGGTEYLFSGNKVQATGNSAAYIIAGDNAQASISIQFNGVGVGSYPCGFFNIPGNAGIQFFIKSSSDSYATSYIQCGQSTMGYSGAPVDIEKFPGVGGMIEGGFSGAVFKNNADPCPRPPSLPLTVRFAALRSR